MVSGRWRRWAGLLALGGAVLVAAPRASATPEAEQEAFRLFRLSADDFKNRDFEAAVEKLEQAYALFPKPLILMKKAEALENAGRIEDAVEAFRAVEPEDKRMGKKVTDAIGRLQVALERPVKVSILSGSVTGARIFLDGTDSGSVTPSVLELARGPHTIRIEADQHVPWESEGFVAKGLDTLVVDAELKLRTGRIVVRLSTGTFEDARVTLDGAPLPIPDPTASTSPPYDVPVGRHELVCIRKGVPAATRTFEADEGQERVLLCALDASMPASQLITGWSLIGGGIAVTGIGSAILAQYFDDKAFAEETGQKLVSNKQIAGPIMIGLGLAAAGGGAYLLMKGPLWSRTTPSGRTLYACPIAAPSPTGHGGLLGLQGSF